MGLLADGVGGLNDFASKPFGYDNPPGRMLAQLLGLPAVANTANELSYGGALGTGKGMTWKPKADTVDAAMTLAPLVAAAPAAINRGAAAVGRRLEAPVSALVDRTMARGGRGADLLQGMAQGTQSPLTVWHGPNPKNNLQDLISSQRYLDRDIVAQKIRDGNFDVKVTPRFEIDGESVRAIDDGHHALEAAIRSGNKPNFIENTATMNDRIGLLDDGNIDGFLEAAYHDAPWYKFATKRDIF
jgi:hypothetical protein